MKKNFGAAVVFIGAAVNLALFLVKLYIALSCNSISIYLDSINNALDSLVCVAAGIGFIIAEKETTQKYPFGFGRTEGVVSFLISVIIIVTGASFLYTSLGRIMFPLPVWYSTRRALTLLLTIPAKFGLLMFYKRASKKQPSAVFGSLGLDSILDFLITLCSLSALVLSEKIGLTFDGIAGLVISLILIVQGIKSVKESLSTLLGKRDGELCERIEKAVSLVDGVKSVKSVQCHSYGKRTVADITIETEDSTVSKDLIEKIKGEIKEENITEIFVGIGG
ncbi:MAG: cation transporter [Ruminococcaceae bacterium]|jgi:cation diffusion facilitator family transporter|nr:cation transporter [Oscillospiraceae bacterium]